MADEGNAAPATQSAPSQNSQESSGADRNSPPQNRDSGSETENAGAPKGQDSKSAAAKPQEKTQEKPKSSRERILELVDEDGNVTVKLHGKPTKLSFQKALEQIEIDGGGRSKFTEAARLRQEAEAIVQRLKEKPEEALRLAGIDPETWAEEQVVRKIRALQAQEQMSPEERGKASIQAERDRFEQEKQQWQEQLQQQHLEAEARRIAPILEKHIPEALDAVGLSKSLRGMERMKDYLRDVIADGEEIRPEHIRYAAEAAKEEAQQDFQELAKGLSPKDAFEFFGPDTLKNWGNELAKDVPQFLSLFGEGVADALRRYDLQEYQKSLGTSQTQPQREQPPQQDGPSYKTEAEYMSQLRRAGQL